MNTCNYGCCPREVLDLFCGEGGAATGLHQAWPHAHIVGVDTAPKTGKRYPFEFACADAMTYPLEGADFIWASPPCQGYSIMRNLPWLRDRTYPLLIGDVKLRLQNTEALYAIENVMGARRELDAWWLCGTMFGLPFYRHRLFETNFFWLQPAHPIHRKRIHSGHMLNHRAAQIVFSDAEDKRGIESWPNRRPSDVGFDGPPNGARRVGANVGHAAGVQDARTAMGLAYMSRDGITQAVPPAFSEYIARQLRIA